MGEPPSAVGSAEVVLGVCGWVGDGVGGNMYVVEDTPCVVPPGEFRCVGYGFLNEEGLRDKWWGLGATEVRHIVGEA